MKHKQIKYQILVLTSALVFSTIANANCTIRISACSDPSINLQMELENTYIHKSKLLCMAKAEELKEKCTYGPPLSVYYTNDVTKKMIQHVILNRNTHAFRSTELPTARKGYVAMSAPTPGVPVKPR